MLLLAAYLRVTPHCAHQARCTASLRMESTRVRKTRSSTQAAASVKSEKAKVKRTARGAASVKAEKAKKQTVTSYEVERDSEGRGYFYFRSEPTSRIQNGVDVKFSYDDLVGEPEKTAHWDGVRNHVAKNWMRAMRVGDFGLFYHSNAADATGVVGVVEVVKEAYPDHTAWDRKDPHYDRRTNPDNPTWYMVEVKAVRKLAKLVARTKLKEPPFSGMYMIKQGRVSVGPVSPDDWKAVVALGDEE